MSDKRDAYTVDDDGYGCPGCGHGGKFYVVDQRGHVAGNQQFSDESVAREFADALNDAHEAGRVSAFQTVGRRKGPEDRRGNINGNPPPEGERRKDSRRHGDDGIPF